MSERVFSKYQLLCQVQVLHHYWLDDGGTLFDSLPKDALDKAALNLPAMTPTREQHLGNYDVRQFLTIKPTRKTSQVLAGLGCFFKNTALGFLLVAPKTAPLPTDAQFEFYLTATHVDFFNYTALTLQAQPIVEVLRLDTQQIERFKKNMWVWSNSNGTVITDAGIKTWFLSRAIPALAVNDRAEALVKIGNALWQLSNDQPGANRIRLSTQISKMPVFVNQADIAADGILLDGMPDEVFGLIRLAAIRPDNDEFSLVTAAGLPKASPPLFQIRFKNRSSRWQYYRGSTAKTAPPIFVEPAPLPLTFFGNASTAKPNKKSKPSGLIKPRLDNSNPPKVLGIDSEIFE